MEFVNIIIIVVTIIVLSITALIITMRKQKNTTYNQLKARLEADLLLYNFTGDYNKRQEVKLQLIWLITVAKVESASFLKDNEISIEESKLDSLTLEDLKFPKTWDLNDFYSYPFSQEILSEFGKVIENTDFKGVFKPESILPVPKKIITKAIYFTFDYFNQKSPIYHISEADKRKRVSALNLLNSHLRMNFIEVDANKLPKTGMLNFEVGDKIKSKQQNYNDIKELETIDWRSDQQWISKGLFYIKNKEWEMALACFDYANKINPNNDYINKYKALTYLYMGDCLLEKGEIILAKSFIEKSAQLNNKHAIEWLANNNN